MLRVTKLDPSAGLGLQSAEHLEEFFPECRIPFIRSGR